MTFLNKLFCRHRHTEVKRLGFGAVEIYDFRKKEWLIEWKDLYQEICVRCKKFRGGVSVKNAPKRKP